MSVYMVVANNIHASMEFLRFADVSVLRTCKKSTPPTLDSSTPMM